MTTPLEAGRQAGYMPVAKTTDWETPKALFDALDQEFGPFTLDPCGQREHHYSAYAIHSRGGLFFDGSCAAMDGLLNDWSGVVFVNPPYGKEMPRWIEKAVREVASGRAQRVVALIPARTDTAMWQTYILRGAGSGGEMGGTWVAAHPLLTGVRFLGKESPGMEGRSRVRFGGAAAAAPFPCAVVVWEEAAFSASGHR